MDERTKQLLALGREHYEQRQFEKAEPFLRQVLERSDRFADVLNMMGVIHHDRGHFEEAKAADTARFGKLHRAMLERGVYLAPSAFEAGFTSLAHSDADIDATIAAFRECFALVA